PGPPGGGRQDPSGPGRQPDHADPGDRARPRDRCGLPLPPGSADGARPPGRRTRRDRAARVVAGPHGGRPRRVICAPARDLRPWRVTAPSRRTGAEVRPRSAPAPGCTEALGCRRREDPVVTTPPMCAATQQSWTWCVFRRQVIPHRALRCPYCEVVRPVRTPARAPEGSGAAMSDRRSSRGSSNGSKRPSSSSSGGARRAAGVRRSTGSSDRAGAKNSKRPAPKATSRTGRNRETASSSRTKAAGAGAGSSGAGARRTSTSGSRTSVGARHAGAGQTRTTKKAAATNFLNYPRAGAKNPWRWIPSLRLIVGAMALMVLAGLGLGVWVYVDTDVPEPTDYALAETTRVYFADGETEMGKFSEINRTILPGEEIPQNVKDAAVASEDASFYENRGVSPRGIVRALINNLRG